MADHLHDEDLSDVVDGVAPPDVLAHVDGCAGCADRLRAMRSAVEAVATPPPTASDSARDAAIGHALDAGAPSRRLPPAWLAVAAAVVVLLGAVAVAMARTGSGNDSTAALDEAKEAPTAAGSAQGLAAGPIDGGDLGDQRDPATLRDLLEGRLNGVAAATSGGGAGTDSAADGGGARSPTREMAPAAPSGPACLDQAQEAGSGRLGALQLYANLRWQGNPAVALVFAAPNGSQLGRRAFVMARRDCSLLVAQSF